MGNFKGVNKTYVDSVPPTMIPPGEQGGIVRVMYDTYELTESMQADTIQMCGLIPKGARVLNAQLFHDDLGTGVTVDVGYEASADAVESADTDAFFNDVDVATAGDHWIASEQTSLAEGLLKKFTASVQPLITFSNNATSTSGTISLVIYYVVD